MAISGTQARYELTATADATAHHVSGGSQIGTPLTTVIYATAPDICYALQLRISDGDALTIDMDTGVVTGAVAGVNQVETFTVVAAGGCTSNGTCDVVVTGANLTGSPITVPVALTTATHTTADLIRSAIGDALTANAVIAAQYTVGGSGANGTLTDIQYRADDATLNVAIPAGLGITAAPTSANTTAGVAASGAYRKSGVEWTPVDHEGFPLPTATLLYSTLIRGISGTDCEITWTGATMPISGTGIYPMLHPDATHPWAGESVSFEATNGDVVIDLDIHAGS